MRARDYGRAERATTVEEKERERATSTVEPEIENRMLGRQSEAVEHVLRVREREREKERVYEGVKRGSVWRAGRESLTLRCRIRVHSPTLVRALAWAARAYRPRLPLARAAQRIETPKVSVNERWHSSVPELATYHATHAQHNCHSVVRERVPKQLSRGDQGTRPRHAEEAACLCRQAAPPLHTARGGYLADILRAR